MADVVAAISKLSQGCSLGHVLLQSALTTLSNWVPFFRPNIATGQDELMQRAVHATMSILGGPTEIVKAEILPNALTFLGLAMPLMDDSIRSLAWASCCDSLSLHGTVAMSLHSQHEAVSAAERLSVAVAHVVCAVLDDTDRCCWMISCWINIFLESCASMPHQNHYSMSYPPAPGGDNKSGLELPAPHHLSEVDLALVISTPLSRILADQIALKLRSSPPTVISRPSWHPSAALQERGRTRIMDHGQVAKTATDLFRLFAIAPTSSNGDNASDEPPVVVRCLTSLISLFFLESDCIMFTPHDDLLHGVRSFLDSACVSFQHHITYHDSYLLQSTAALIFARLTTSPSYAPSIALPSDCESKACLHVMVLRLLMRNALPLETMIIKPEIPQLVSVPHFIQRGFQDAGLLAQSILISLDLNSHQSHNPDHQFFIATSLLGALHEESSRICQVSSMYVIRKFAVGSPWTQQGTSASRIVFEGQIRDVMDKVYVCAMSILDSIAGIVMTRHRVIPFLDQLAAKMLSTMAEISFCSVPHLGLAASLNSKVLSALQASPNGCFCVLSHMPCYTDAIKIMPLDNSHPMALWQLDDLLVGKLLKFLSAAASCLPSCRDISGAVSKLLPYAYLLLRHPQGEACLAAHDVISSCLSAVCDGNGLLEAKGTEPRILIQALPYYVQRCLQKPWMSHGQISGLLRHFPRLMRMAYPLSRGTDGANALRWALDAIASAAAQWLAEGHQNTSGGAVATRVPDFTALLTDDVAPRGLSGADLRTGSELISLACSLPLLAQWNDLGKSMELVEWVVSAASPGHVRVVVLQHCHDLYSRSDDYSRKVHVAEWFRKLLSADSKLIQQQRGGKIMHSFELA